MTMMMCEESKGHMADEVEVVDLVVVGQSRMIQLLLPNRDMVGSSFEVK